MEKTAHYLGRLQLTAGVMEMWFRAENPAEAAPQAGQYISLALPSLEKPRPYSLLTSPEEFAEQNGLLRLCVGMNPDDSGTQDILALQAGDPLAFVGPSGKHIFQSESPRRKALFLASGTGVAPFVAMTNHALCLERAYHITLVHGLRHEGQIYYRDRFTALQQRHENFHYHLYLSQPHSTWGGDKGRIQQYIDQHVEVDNDTEIYLCGHWNMVQELSKELVEKGFAAEQVHNEMTG